MDANEIVKVIGEAPFMEKHGTAVNSSAIVRFKRKDGLRMYAEIDKNRIWFDQITLWPNNIAFEHRHSTICEYKIKNVIEVVVQSEVNGFYLFINRGCTPLVIRLKLQDQIIDYFGGK